MSSLDHVPDLDLPRARTPSAPIFPYEIGETKCPLQSVITSNLDSQLGQKQARFTFFLKGALRIVESSFRIYASLRCKPATDFRKWYQTRERPVRDLSRDSSQHTPGGRALHKHGIKSLSRVALGSTDEIREIMSCAACLGATQGSPVPR